MGGIWDWTLTVGVTAIPLSNHSQRITSLQIQASRDNTGVIFVGEADSQSTTLAAGASETIPIDCPTKVYARASIAGQVVNVHAVDEGRRHA